MPFQAVKVKALGVILLNKFGLKFYSKYYTSNSSTQFSKSDYDIRIEQGQQKLQKSIFQKIKKMNVASGMSPQNSQIFSFAGFTILFKIVHQLVVILLCQDDENYVLMENVINCIGKVMLILTTEPYVQKVIQDNLDSIVIIFDEILDDGIIMCLDQNLIFDRLKMREPGVSQNKIPTPAKNQQTSSTFNSLFGFAKNTLQKTLNLG